MPLGLPLKPLKAWLPLPLGQLAEHLPGLGALAGLQRADEVVDPHRARAVERGESFTISRNGTPIGRLIPLRRRVFVPREEVMAAFATAPVLDAEKFRSDLDALADQDLTSRDW